MAKAMCYTDDSDQEQQLKVLVNADNRLYIEAGSINDSYYIGFVTLGKEDVAELIEDLKKCLEEM